MAEKADFEDLVDRHYAPLYRFALSLSGQETDARDLTQQTFYLWATKGHHLRDSSKAKSWLFTTLYREFLQRQRKTVRFPQVELEETMEELPTTNPKMVEGIDGAAAVRMLEQMQPAFRGPIALFYLEDYSYKEIAEILEVPLGTVKSRISRGIAQLQAAFRQRSNPPKQGDQNESGGHRPPGKRTGAEND